MNVSREVRRAVAEHYDLLIDVDAEGNFLVEECPTLGAACQALPSYRDTKHRATHQLVFAWSDCDELVDYLGEEFGPDTATAA
ncbi:hypothetical protein [Rhodococcus aetherivorans]|uniref:hypothetical protein n=1 Tax=Rhodococcus aetherivorans TaxID=191292 RepID=UPI001E2E6EA1|nr:hypothetical protein [Rhodococcus aetherivorans]UGQ39381.1 hypothetical protein LRQ66_14285 [Rhodococcus aetherivorans]